MKTLLILRHAKSSWKDQGLSDYDRPLNNRGKADAPRMGQLLRIEGMVPDLIISSSAKRARMTTEYIVEESGFDGEVVLTRELYAVGPEAHIESLNVLGDEHERVMLVGHNPGLEELLELLTGEMERLPTAALAEVSLPIDRWQDLTEDTTGELVGLWQPKEI